MRRGPNLTDLTDRQLTDQLASRVLGWRAQGDRFLKSGKSWEPRWRFSPLSDIACAFELLHLTGAHYAIRHDSSEFSVELEIGALRANATGIHLARTI